MGKIPFVDLATQYENLRHEVVAKIQEVLESRSFIQGKYVEEFEESFARAQGVTCAVGCSSGTSAISLALEALGVGQGDEVITTVNTFFATAGAICHVGAKPVFVDIDADTGSLDVDLLEQAISSRTKAIIPVHLFGNPCPIDRVMKIANEHNLHVVEDCAQAHLAKFNGRGVGSFGAFGTFSFYPGKNLGAYGDAGLVVSNSSDYAALVAKLRDHGRSDKYVHEIIGYNHRMDGIQGAVLSIKLNYLSEWTENRRRAARWYDERLASLGVRSMQITEGAEPVYHLYVIELDGREKVMEHLKQEGIASGIHYPLPLHLQPAFENLQYQRGDFPVAEKSSERILSLPIFPEISEEQVDRICSELAKVV